MNYFNSTFLKGNNKNTESTVLNKVSLVHLKRSSQLRQCIDACVGSLIKTAILPARWLRVLEHTLHAGATAQCPECRKEPPQPCSGRSRRAPLPPTRAASHCGWPLTVDGHEKSKTRLQTTFHLKALIIFLNKAENQSFQPKPDSKSNRSNYFQQTSEGHECCSSEDVNLRLSPTGRYWELPVTSSNTPVPISSGWQGKAPHNQLNLANWKV